METLLPSEIARLVYGYLVEEKCNEAADTFLKTSEHLKECLAASQGGKKFQTKFNGRNLVAILDVLSQVKSQAQIIAANLSQSSYNCEKLNELFDLLGVEIPSSTVVDSPSSELEDFSVNMCKNNFKDEPIKPVENSSLPPSPAVIEPRPDSSIDIIDLNDGSNVSKMSDALPSTSQALPSENLISSHSSNNEQNPSTLSEPICVDLGISDLDDEVAINPDSSSKTTLKDSSINDVNDVVCLSPNVDVIEIDEDEPEEERQDLVAARNSILPTNPVPEPTRSFKRRFRKRKNRDNHGYFKGAAAHNLSSLFHHQNNIAMIRYMHESNRSRCAAAQHACQPSTSSGNPGYPSFPWSKANSRLQTSAFSSVPSVMVNRSIMQASPVGSFTRRRNHVSLQEGAHQIISEELVTHVMTNSTDNYQH